MCVCARTHVQVGQKKMFDQATTKNMSENLELYLEFNLRRVLKLAEIVIVNYV